MLRLPFCPMGSQVESVALQERREREAALFVGSGKGLREWVMFPTEHHVWTREDGDRFMKLLSTNHQPKENEMDLFSNRAPTPEQADVLDTVTAHMLGVADFLEKLPPSRFRSLAMTKLEEVSMWAKKAVVFTVDVDVIDEGA